MTSKESTISLMEEEIYIGNRRADHFPGNRAGQCSQDHGYECNVCNFG